MRAILTLCAAALTLAGCGDSRPAPDVDTSVYGAGDNWDNPAGDWAESHFSRLTSINADNASELGLAWEYNLGSSRVQEASPVVIDGVMYTSGVAGRAYALNAATGEELWTFLPEVDMQVNRATCCDMPNRGVVVQMGPEGGRQGGKVFVAALDGWLYALDAESGEIVWQTDTIIDRSRGYTSTGAPELAGDLVMIGNGGAEADVRGYVSAYDTTSGELVWRFYTIPGDPDDGPQETQALEDALETWDPDSRWDIGGGGTVWDAITYDPLFDQVIIGIGNGGPYPRATRSPEGGDNLYLDSLVALDRATGQLKWYFQETPGDSWDFTASQPLILTEMELDGEMRPVALHTPKNGFYFVVDRETGKPLVAEPIVRTSWASGWDLESGRPILTPEYSDYATGPKIVFPSAAGARNWHPAAYDPQRGLYFGAVVDLGNLMFIPPGMDQLPHRERVLNPGAALIFTSELEGALPALPPPLQEAVKALPQWEQVQQSAFSSQLRAMDAATGEVKWAVDLEGWQDRGGVLATEAGLVIHGDLAGRLMVRNADTGELLHAIETGSSILAAPMTYAVDGVQYIAVQTGWGGGGWSFTPPYSAAYSKGNRNRLLVFKLGGGEVPIPDDLPPLQPAPEPPAQAPDVTPELIAKGNGLFMQNCMTCHSNQARAPLPDLRRMNAGVHEAFDQIVLEGLLVGNGMPRWDDLLTQEDTKAIQAFLIAEQEKTRARELDLQRRGLPLDTRALAILSSY